MSDAGWELEAAFVAALKASSEVATLVGTRIFTAVPEPGTTYPYVMMNPTSTLDWSTGTDDGEEHQVSFQVWDDSPGTKRVRQVAQAIHDVLCPRVSGKRSVISVTMTSHRLVNLHRLNVIVEEDQSHQLYQSFTQYRAITEEI